jgi:glucokinase
MSQPAFTLGIDIGGTKIAAAVVADDGALVGYNEQPTPASRGAQAIIDAAVRAAEIGRAAGTHHVTACGVGTAGVVDTDGAITHSTDALTGWVGTNVRDRIAGTLGLPTTVLNDVHACALGEARFGAIAGFRDALTIAIGTGIGGAITHKGQLVAGATGTAGSIGHVAIDPPTPRRCTCGRWNHLEAFAAGPAIESDYHRLTGEATRLPDIAIKARHGDSAALSVIRAAASLVGRTLGQVVNLLDPDVILITGGVAALQDLIAEPIRRGIADDALPGPDRVQLLFSTLGPRAAILGAAAVARDR